MMSAEVSVSSNVDTAIVVLAPREGASLAAAVDAEAEKLAAGLPQGSSLHVAHLIDDPFDLGSEWTAVLEFHGDVKWFVAELAGLADRLGPTVDAARSAAVLGTDHIIFERPLDPSVPPVKMYYALFGYDGYDPEEFARMWRDGHAPLVHSSPYQVTYHQLHGDSESTAAACAAAGLGITDIAGVAHEEFANKEALAAAAIDPELAQERDDVGLFADRERSRGLLTHTRLIAG
jgi:hypothetical protein